MLHILGGVHPVVFRIMPALWYESYLLGLEDHSSTMVKTWISPVQDKHITHCITV